MHILVTAYGYPEVNSKGNPFVKELAEALVRKGAKVSVIQFVFISPVNLIKSFFSFKKITNWQKSKWVNVINSYYINFIPGTPFFLKLQKQLILFSAGMRLQFYILANGKPNLIQQHYIINAQPWITEYLSKKFNIPYVLFEHSPMTSLDGAEKKLHPYYSKEELLLFVKKAKYRIARSLKFKSIYESLYNSEFIVLPSLVAENHLNVPLPSFPKKIKPFFFITIGSFIPRKCHKRTINAFILKFNHIPDVFLHIVGDGPLLGELKKIVKESKMEHRIFMHGLLSREEVFKMIDNSHAVIVASENESFGNTITESFFRGVPAISTRCGGPEEIINPTNGLLSEKNEEDLAKKMWEMYSNYHQFDPMKIMEDAKGKYSENIVTKQIMYLYQIE